jgi:photosystem II stability/assembly factor-like uncharacterized protein
MGGGLGTVCISTNGAKSFQCATVEGYDSSEFRSIYAFNDSVALICNTASPAHILRTTNQGQSWEVVYEIIHPDAFIDGIDFWNEQEGICFGDPINGKMLVLRTSDGGKTWIELLGDSKPLLADGEASFAASGTSIRCYDSSKVYVATGGDLSRLLYSENRAVSWRTILTPIIQGSPSTGIFSFDFFNSEEGIIVGGDFKNDTSSTNHVFYTPDAGKTWHMPESPTRGYRECVQYISENKLIALGPGGIDVSYDGGKNWSKFSDEKKFHAVRKARNGKLVVIAGGSGRAGTVELGDR